MAEMEDDQPGTDGYVRFRPLDRLTAEVVLRLDAWEKLGAPETLEVDRRALRRGHARDLDPFRGHSRTLAQASAAS